MKSRSLVFSILAAFLVFGCASDPNRPDWVNRPPAEPLFYVGIGTSNTGNQSVDYDRALAKAKVNLAAEISAKVQSQLDTMMRSDSRGMTYEEATETITQSVDQHLQAVETVDSYYSRRSGYWIYLRLNKAEWERIQRREMAALENRVRDLTETSLKDSVPVGTRLSVLAKGWEIARISPYAELVVLTLGGRQGTLLDLLEREIVRLAGSLTLSDLPPQKTILIGRPTEIRVRLASTAGPTGEIPLGFFGPSGRNELQGTTDDSGVFQGQVRFQALGLGKTRLSVKPDLSAFGVDPSRLGQRAALPEASVLVDVRQIPVGFSVSSNRSEATGLDRTFGTLFSARDLPFKTSTGTPDDLFQIRVGVTFRDFPKQVENAPDIAEATASLTLEKEGRVLYSYETSPIKTGGPSRAQAYSRVVQKLLRKMSNDRQMLKKISDTVQFE